jgi:ABC-2 type transport system ATP-binding protein
MPVAQLIRFAATLSDADPARIGEVAGRLGLDVDQFRRHPFFKLSGGQKQKLLISIALGRDCDLLMMDEPAANLDPEARHIFFELLADKREHSAMLISSHRLDEVATLVNRVVEMDQGKVILDDRVDDLVDMASKLYCRIGILRPEPAFARAIAQWGFTADERQSVWEGWVAGPDRLRFLGVLSRYAALLSHIHMDEPNIQTRSA